MKRVEKHNPAQLTIFDELRRIYRDYYRANAPKRRAQRLASLYGHPKEWRQWLRGDA